MHLGVCISSRLPLSCAWGWALPSRIALQGLTSSDDGLPHLAMLVEAFKVAEHVWLKTRLEYSQGRFESSIPELNQANTTDFGGSIALKPNRVIDFAIAEDLSVAHSHDVSFHARLAARF